MIRITVIFIALVLCACEREPEIPPSLQNIEGLIIESPPGKIPDFALKNQNNEPVDSSIWKEKWNLVFFGYTNCPDVCPTSMNVFADMLDNKDTPDTNYFFVSVDPQRDTPERLSKFLPFFHEKIQGLTGEKKEIDKFAEPLGVIYGYEDKDASGNYIVTHFAALYIIDNKARLRAYILPPHTAERVNDLYQQIRKVYE